MAHVSEKVKVNMLLLWCGPDGEDIYDGFNLNVHQQYDLDLIWSLFDKHCEPTCNFCTARWKFRTVAQAPSETLDTFYNIISPPSEVEQKKPRKKTTLFRQKKRFQGKKALFLCLTNNLLTFITQSFL